MTLLQCTPRPPPPLPPFPPLFSPLLHRLRFHRYHCTQHQNSLRRFEVARSDARNLNQTWHARPSKKAGLHALLLPVAWSQQRKGLSRCSDRSATPLSPVPSLLLSTSVCQASEPVPLSDDDLSPSPRQPPHIHPPSHPRHATLPPDHPFLAAPPSLRR